MGAASWPAGRGHCSTRHSLAPHAAPAAAKARLPRGRVARGGERGRGAGAPPSDPPVGASAPFPPSPVSLPRRQGNVPALVLADGTLLNEGIATLSWIADQARVANNPGRCRVAASSLGPRRGWAPLLALTLRPAPASPSPPTRRAEAGVGPAAGGWHERPLPRPGRPVLDRLRAGAAPLPPQTPRPPACAAQKTRAPRLFAEMRAFVPSSSPLCPPNPARVVRPAVQPGAVRRPEDVLQAAPGPEVRAAEGVCCMKMGMHADAHALRHPTSPPPAMQVRLSERHRAEGQPQVPGRQQGAPLPPRAAGVWRWEGKDLT